MNLVLSPMVRRATALAILFSLLFVVWSVVVWPLVGLAQHRLAENVALSERIEQLQTVIARRPPLERRLERAKSELAVADGLWSNGSSAVAAAGMQDRLREAVSASGGRLNSVSEIRESAEGGFRKITLRFRIEGTLDAIVSTLATVDMARPALFADNVAITVAQNASDRKAPPMLDLDLEISSYLEVSGS